MRKEVPEASKRHLGLFGHLRLSNLMSVTLAGPGA